MARGAQQWGGAEALLVRSPGRGRLMAAFGPERARPPIECQQSPDPQQVLYSAGYMHRWIDVYGYISIKEWVIHEDMQVETYTSIVFRA
jgi:hypothetical protein